MTTLLRPAPARRRSRRCRRHRRLAGWHRPLPGILGQQGAGPPVTFNEVSTTFIGGTNQTGDLASGAYTAGRRICVIGHAQRAAHTNGLDTDFIVTDDATTNSITWTPVHTSSIFGVAADGIQVKVWISSVLTDDETFVVTLDGEDGGTSLFRYRGSSVELENSDGTIGLVDSAFDADGNTSFDLGDTPSLPQLISVAYFGPGGNNWDAPPATFTTIGTVQQTEVISSASNTDQTIDFGGSTTEDTVGVHLEFNSA